MKKPDTAKPNEVKVISVINEKVKIAKVVG